MRWFIPVREFRAARKVSPSPNLGRRTWGVRPNGSRCRERRQSHANTCRVRGGEWHITGSKRYITNSGKADFYFVFAKTSKGYASIIVPKEREGLFHKRNIPKMGLPGLSLRGLNFDDVVVPEENLVGIDGEGFDYAKKMLAAGRITIAALSVGIAQTAFEKTDLLFQGEKGVRSRPRRFRITLGEKSPR